MCSCVMLVYCTYLMVIKLLHSVIVLFTNIEPFLIFKVREYFQKKFSLYCLVHLAQEFNNSKD